MSASRSDLLWKSLLRTQFVLGITNKDLASMLAMTPEAFEKASVYRSRIPARSLMALCEQLGVSFDAIMSGQIDYKCLAQNFNRGQSTLPERYQHHAYSRRRTVIGILDCIESAFGIEKRALVLRRCQVNEAMLKDPEAPINLNLSLDIASYFHRLGGDTRVLEMFGQHSVNTNRDSEMGKLMSVARNPQESIEFLVQAILPRFVERNYTWRLLSVRGATVRVAGIPNEFLQWEMARSPEVHRLGCHIRGGYIGGAPRLAGFEALQVRKLTCVADGHPWCEFELAEQKLMQPSLQSLAEQC